MGLDINLFRTEKGGDPEKIKASEKKRGRDTKIVDEIVKIDIEWRKAIYNLEQLKRDCNAVSKDIGKFRKEGKDCRELIAKSSVMKEKIPFNEQEVNTKASLRECLVLKVGNILHSSVPIAEDEAENCVISTYGEHLCVPVSEGRPNLHHHEIMSRLGALEMKKGVEVAGHRGYYLKGVGAILSSALVQYGLNFLIKRGFMPVQPPFFMKKEVMSHAAELKDFEETLYKIPSNEPNSRDDLFLIATSEQPLAALHKGENLVESQLPFKYAGVSTCFRKEAGAHGKETWGLFRIHQFEKVEQFCITHPDKSWEMQEEMIDCSEAFYKSLKLPYRVVSIVSGALNDAAARKFDLEAWFPGYQQYKELVSCSNCTDYQARSLDIKLGHKTHVSQESQYVHMLNGTLVAAQRCLCCIVENYQTPDGVVVPKALIPYMGGMEFLPYPK